MLETTGDLPGPAGYPGSVRFLFTRRWVLFGVVVAALAYLAAILGQWQFHRLDDRRAENKIVATNLARAPIPIADFLSADRPVAETQEWQRVVARGTWDDANSIVIRYQTREGQSGVDVVTPLRTDDGPAILVDRGWMPTDNSGADRPDTPPAAQGTVTVVGWVRADGTGRSTRVSDLSARAISSRAAAEVLDYPLYQGFLDLERQTPDAGDDLQQAELPDDTSEGPHFFYGLQWWFFGVLAVGGFGYLAYDEYRRMKRGRSSALFKSETEPTSPLPEPAEQDHSAPRP